VILIHLLAAAILYACLLRWAHIRPGTIAIVVALNSAVFLLLVPLSMALGVLGVLTTGTLSYVACLPRRARFSPATLCLVVVVDAVGFLVVARDSPALGASFLIIAIPISGAALLARDAGG
jgi:hypothetical protein